VIGLMNIQLAVKGEHTYVIEVNPRASRTAPFVSKATGTPFIRIAAKVMMGKTLKECGVTRPPTITHVAVKDAVFPFDKFPEVDPVLGPEMKSTGEVMGIDIDFGRAYAKAQIAAGNRLPTTGRVCISVHDADKPGMLPIARRLLRLGFTLCGTSGTARYLNERGVTCDLINKVGGPSPSLLSEVESDQIALILNTPLGAQSQIDDYHIRTMALRHKVPYTTTLSAAYAAVSGIESMLAEPLDVRALQDYHAGRLQQYSR
jgi:carbamoyl-phosphate synthase large subunit